MRDDALMKRLREAFREESAERLDGMSKQLVRLEKARTEAETADALDLFYRDVHSLKGAARAIQFPGVEEVSQAVEEMLSRLKDDGRSPGSGALDLLHEALGVLRRLVKAGKEDPGGELDREARNTLARLSAVRETTEGESLVPETGDPAPRAGKPAPGDDVASGQETRSFLAGSIRVPVRKLDSLLRRSEEFIELKLAAEEQLRAFAEVAARVPGARREVQGVLREGEHHLLRMSSMVDGLIKEMKDVTLLPVSILFDLLPIMVRDLCKAQGKEVKLTLKGGEVQVDRRVLDEIKDPLIHLVRNAIDHGFRHTERDGGGSPGWILRVEASQVDANLIALEVTDNGHGMDADSISDAAVELGIASQASVEGLSRSEQLSLAYFSGVSTTREVTTVSGRGLGLSVVSGTVERMGGSLAVQSEPGRGTRFRMVLPVTMATVRGLVVRAGASTFLVPTSDLRRVTRIPQGETTTVQGKTAYADKGSLLRVTHLDTLLGLPEAPEGDGSFRASGAGTYFQTLVLGEDSDQVALVVDEVEGEVEVLTKGLGPQLGHVRHIAGATKLGDGSLALILNIKELLETIHSGPLDHEVRSEGLSEAPGKGQAAVLVVEDSITSRTLLRNVLESAGYKVTTAVDGQEALTLLKRHPFDAVVSDVEMPRLDGLALTETIRADRDLRELPVILVSSLDRPDQREAGIRAGADAYVGKSSFDQANLLDVLRRYC